MNNLNDDENFKISFAEKINGKNIEVESISSPSSVILSEENNTSKVVIELLDSSKVTRTENEKDESKNNEEEEENDKNNFEETSIDMEKYQNSNIHSQATSKFCLINDEKDAKSQLFSPKASVFLKENSGNKKFFHPKASTINKILFLICIFSIGLFAASICYIVIAHLTLGFNAPGFAIFKTDSNLISKPAVTVNIKVS